MEVHQALPCLHGDLGGLVYPNLSHQGLRPGIGLRHLQKPGNVPQSKPSAWWLPLKPGVHREIGDSTLGRGSTTYKQSLACDYQEMK